MKVADITITDDGAGTNNLTLSGNDAALFEVFDGDLYLKAGTVLDFEGNPTLDVTVAVDDPAVGARRTTARRSWSLSKMLLPRRSMAQAAPTHLPER